MREAMMVSYRVTKVDTYFDRGIWYSRTDREEVLGTISVKEGLQPGNLTQAVLRELQKDGLIPHAYRTPYTLVDVDDLLSLEHKKTRQPLFYLERIDTHASFSAPSKGHSLEQGSKHSPY